DDLSADCRQVIEAAASSVSADGRDPPTELRGLSARQPVVHGYEGARALAWKRSAHPEELSTGLRSILDWGAAITPDEYDASMRAATRARSVEVTEQLFGAADVLITPA